MSQSIYLFTRLPLPQLEEVINVHKEEFDNFLKDNFSEEELIQFERMTDHLAAITVQSIFSELSFDDFYADESVEEEQRKFFESCRSSVCLENLPFLESNSFQVYYLSKLLSRFDNVLVDQGGVSELLFKSKFIKELEKYKSIDQFLVKETRPVEIRSTPSRPVDPIDFLILDVYKELNRLNGRDLCVDELPPKIQKIFHVMKEEKLDATQLLRKVGLNPKEFDDGLERLKFWLRKI